MRNLPGCQVLVFFFYITQYNTKENGVKRLYYGSLLSRDRLEAEKISILALTRGRTQNLGDKGDFRNISALL